MFYHVFHTNFDHIMLEVKLFHKIIVILTSNQRTNSIYFCHWPPVSPITFVVSSFVAIVTTAPFIIATLSCEVANIASSGLVLRTSVSLFSYRNDKGMS